MTAGCCAMQLIDGKGEFNVEGLKNFMKAWNLADGGPSYGVVSILGPQSSGKSTLLNNLFRTNFEEMDAAVGRAQTTKGIWIANCVGIEPPTICIDMEGTDGKERGEDDTAFEKKSALFALAISDVLMINMWYHEIGRESAANRPLLRTIFKVMMRLFSPRKSTLLLVIRDKPKRPIPNLENYLKKDMEEIWDAVIKTHDVHMKAPLNQFFKVKITFLSSYERELEKFKNEVAELKQQFFHSSSPEKLACNRGGVAPAAGFSLRTQQIWKVIKEYKDLDLPSLKIMVSTIRCEEIANEKLGCLTSNEGWLALERKGDLVPGFGKKLNSILEKCFSEYDCETRDFEEGVRVAKREQLMSKALEFVHSAYTNMLAQLRSEAFESFKTRLEQSLNVGIGFASCVHICTQSCMLEFDQGCEETAIRHANLDASNVRDKLRGDVHEHASAVRSAQLAKLRATYEEQVTIELKEPVKCLLREASQEDVWASIRNHLETLTAVSEFSNAVDEFDLDQAAVDTMVQEIRDYARSLVEVLAREESRDVLMFMNERFWNVFYHDTDSRPDVWTDQREDMIGTITRDACSAALKVLSVMAAIRLTERPDAISHSLFSSLMVDPSSQDSTTIAPTDPLAFTTWEEVSPENTLITPVKCVLYWKLFLQRTRAFTHAASICNAQNSATHAHSLENGPSPSSSSPSRLLSWLNSAFQAVKDLAPVALIAAEGTRYRRAVKIMCKVLDVLSKLAERGDPR